MGSGTDVVLLHVPSRVWRFPPGARGNDVKGRAHRGAEGGGPGDCRQANHCQRPGERRSASQGRGSGLSSRGSGSGRRYSTRPSKRSVLVYGQGFLRGAEGQIVAQEFQKQTGIKVDLVEISGGSGTYQRIQQEMRGGAPTADIALVTPPFPGVMEKDGVFTTLKDKPLPIFKEPKSVWKTDPMAMSDGGAFLINVPNSPLGTS